MKYKPVKDRCCQNEKCQDFKMYGEGNISRHSKYKTRQGRRRRYLCKTCKKTFCSTKGTPYYRLHQSCSIFDEVVQMTVEGVEISTRSGLKLEAQGAELFDSAFFFDTGLLLSAKGRLMM